MIKGIYALKIYVEPDYYKIGSLGTFYLSGYYFYIGSAMNGLYQRICYHVNSKNKRWHIDYIDNNIIKIIFAVTDNKNYESIISNDLGKGIIKKFGSTDTKDYSHLFNLNDEKIINSFKKYGLKPHILSPDCNELKDVLENI